MDISLAVQSIWPLAAEEAKAGRQEFITRAHLFMTLLKFAELPDEVFAGLGPAGAAELVEERDALRAGLARAGIAVPEVSHKLRRGLRRHLGRGGHQHQPEEVIHRSPGCRDCFRQAAGLARAGGQRALTATPLLEALLAQPPDAVKQALAESVPKLAAPAPAAETPWLNKYGQYLRITLIKGGDGDPTDAAVKVMERFLARDDRKGLLLVDAGGARPDLAAAALHSALERASSDWPPMGRIWGVFLDRLLSPSPPDNAPETIFEQLALEARARNLCLYLHDFSVLLRPDLRDGPLALAVRQTLEGKSVRIMAGLDTAAYEALTTGDGGWRGLFHPIWLHYLIPDFHKPIRMTTGA